MAFLDDRYLLSGDTAAELYGQIRDLPIIDAHNHLDVKALVSNAPFPDIWETEAATDHYVWECLRKRGVAEALLTDPEVPNREKWDAMAAVFPDLAGNPTYEWVHLDLKRILGIDELICAENAEGIWEKARAALARPEMRPQALVQRMKVEAMCSTDDPIDSLEFHQALQDTPLAGVVRPTFRPDRAMNVFKHDWPEYVERLEARVNGSFRRIGDLIEALRVTHDYFADHGCVASDHGVEVPFGYDMDEEDANEVFRRARRGEELEDEEVICYMSYVLGEVAEMDARKDWVFQVHIGAVRDMRDLLYDDIGPDSGGDISDHMTDIVEPLIPLLNRMDERLKVVLYNLNPAHTATLAHLTRAFGEKVNLGAAWWLNDSYMGMRRQLEFVGTVDVLMNCAGMVSDSRKLLSYASRHEVFRRTLADVAGALLDRGQVPMAVAERLVRHLAYERPKQLFGL
ncbi:MAG: glucuronate isomerase [Lentisphaeria bacterium]|nr:glucuronate isomerase [Lentisphaeria bacterium]